MPCIELSHRLEYQWLGPPPDAAPTLVLLHHGLGAVTTWGRLPAELAARTGYGVLVYSRAGYGQSEPVPPTPRPVTFMHREAEGDLPELLAALEVRGPILVGHSDGGSIALLYAASQPSLRPRGLVVIAAHVFVEGLTLDGARAARVRYEEGDLRHRLARVHADPDGAFYGWNGTWLQPAFAAWNIEAELARIPWDCPVMALQGAADEYGTPAQLEALRRGLGEHPALEVHLIQGCGHLLPRERPEAVLDAVQKCGHAARTQPRGSQDQ